MNYELMMAFVKEKLESQNAIKPSNPYHFFRDRYMHTVRVLEWCKKIHMDLPCNLEILYTAAIFHDVGYKSVLADNHAKAGTLIFLDYAKENNFDEEFTKEVAYLILNHSDKSLLKDPNTKNELIILLEADLLDEEGALGIVWDMMAIAAKGDCTYYDSLEALHHSLHILDQDFMVTKIAKEIWERKKKLVLNFDTELKQDLFYME